MFPILAIFLILRLVGISGKGREKLSTTKKVELACFYLFFLETLPIVSCMFHGKLQAGVWNRGTFRVLLFIDIIRRKYTKSYNIEIFSYPDVGVIFEKYIKSKDHKFADTDTAVTLDSFYGETINRKIHRKMGLR